MSAADEVTPFMAVLAAARPDVRPLAMTLPVQPSAPARSPWTPSVAIEPVGGASPAAHEAEALLAAARASAQQIRAEAAEAGRAEGARALDAQRCQLATLVTELQRQRAARDEKAAEMIATAAVTVIEAWLGHAVTGADRFAPLVCGWLAADPTESATARVHPGDAEALRTAIGDAPITVTPDPEMAAGDLRITAGGRELDHRWADRLRELREFIAASVAATVATRATGADA